MTWTHGVPRPNLAPSTFRGACSPWFTLAQKDTKDNRYQKLEWYGDAVLQFLVSDYLFRASDPQWDEGDLTQLRSHLVNNDALAYRWFQETAEESVWQCPDGVCTNGDHCARSTHAFLNYESNASTVGEKHMADRYEAHIGAAFLEHGDLKTTWEMFKSDFEVDLDVLHKCVENVDWRVGTQGSGAKASRSQQDHTRQEGEGQVEADNTNGCRIDKLVEADNTNGCRIDEPVDGENPSGGRIDEHEVEADGVPINEPVEGEVSRGVRVYMDTVVGCGTCEECHRPAIGIPCAESVAGDTVSRVADTAYLDPGICSEIVARSDSHAATCSDSALDQHVADQHATVGALLETYAGGDAIERVHVHHSDCQDCGTYSRDCASVFSRFGSKASSLKSDVTEYEDGDGGWPNFHQDISEDIPSRRAHRLTADALHDAQASSSWEASAVPGERIPTPTRAVAPTETRAVAPTETAVAPTETRAVAPTETRAVAPTETRAVAPTDTAVVPTETAFVPAEMGNAQERAMNSIQRGTRGCRQVCSPVDSAVRSAASNVEVHPLDNPGFDTNVERVLAHHFNKRFQLLNGWLCLSHRPKKKQLAQIGKQLGQGVIWVTLLNEREQSAEVIATIRTHGMGSIWVPIETSQICNDGLLRGLRDTRNALDAGRAVVVHCSAGIHRTGAFGYALLRVSGYDAPCARDILTELRSHTEDSAKYWPDVDKFLHEQGNLDTF